MKSFRDLKFWDRTHKLVVRVYEVSRGFPKEELINLTATIRRCVTSIGSLLVEGMAVAGEREPTSHVQNAIAATGQLEYLVLLSRDLGYMDEAAYQELTTETIELRRLLVSHLVKIRTLR